MSEGAAAAAAAPTAAGPEVKPMLVFFYSALSGSSRRADGFLAQVLQRRRNHDTFAIRRVEYETHLDLAERLRVEHLPTLLVIEGKRVRARLERPRGCVAITKLLEPWLK